MKSLNLEKIGQTRWWWTMLVVGILLVMAGFFYWFRPETGYAVASQIFGWLLILAGVVQLCAAVGPHRPKNWGWWIPGGVINMFIGFMLVRSVILSEMVLPYFLAIIFIFRGLEAFVSAGSGRRTRYRWVEIVNGILMCLIAFFFIEAGWVSDMMMVSFLTSVAFIYWGCTTALASYEMKPRG